jgi:hypothetical protein
MPRGSHSFKVQLNLVYPLFYFRMHSRRLVSIVWYLISIHPGMKRYFAMKPNISWIFDYQWVTPS